MRRAAKREAGIRIIQCAGDCAYQDNVCRTVSSSYGPVTAISAVNPPVFRPICVGLAAQSDLFGDNLIPSNQSGRMSQEALLHLWRQYKDSGDHGARDRLVFSLAPIVKSIVYRKVREIP